MSAGDEKTGRKTAIVLFNLGGPDSLEAVQPFLFNLFYDPAILRMPRIPRWLVAKLISSRRTPTAQEIYRQLGGRSPIVEQTTAQAEALEQALNEGAAGGTYRVFMAMRYWHPRAAETARTVRAFDPDDMILLPLYPQFSTTTSASSIAEWVKEAQAAGVRCPSRAICCYPTQPGWIAAQALKIKETLAAMPDPVNTRLLFSAHGLPEKIVESGDPYQWQVERTVAAIIEALDLPGLDPVICYQSRVGPLKWIGPSTEDEIARAGRDGKACLVAPVAFVSEHSETLVELDIEYREFAGHCNVPHYARVPAVGTQKEFIAGLASLIRNFREDRLVASETGSRLCPMSWSGCAFGDTSGERE